MKWLEILEQLWGKEKIKQKAYCVNVLIQVMLAAEILGAVLIISSHLKKYSLKLEKGQLQQGGQWEVWNTSHLEKVTHWGSYLGKEANVGM